MRKLLIAGLAAAVAFVIANRALVLLNQRSNAAVAAGYLLLLGLVAVATGVVSRLWRRS